MIYIILAIAYGITNIVSRSINYMLSERIGVYQSTLFNYITGLVGSVLLLFLSGQAAALIQAGSYQAPWIAYTGGLIGVAVVTLMTFLSCRVSSFYLTLSLFIGQIFTGILLDYLSQGILSIYQVLGGLLVIVGLSFNLYIDYKDSKKKCIEF